jgi:hydrogenase maturation protease
VEAKKDMILIIGIGNEFRSDDGYGLIIVRKLREKINSAVRVIEHSGDGASLMEEWKGFDKVIIIDAVCFGKKPGTVHLIDANKEHLPPEKMHHSSHIFGLNDAIETARVLKRLPQNIQIFGVEGKLFGTGTSMSAEIHDTIPDVVDKIMEGISKRIQ